MKLQERQMVQELNKFAGGMDKPSPSDRFRKGLSPDRQSFVDNLTTHLAERLKDDDISFKLVGSKGLSGRMELTVVASDGRHLPFGKKNTDHLNTWIREYTGQADQQGKLRRFAGRFFGRSQEAPSQTPAPFSVKVVSEHEYNEKPHYGSVTLWDHKKGLYKTSRTVRMAQGGLVAAMLTAVVLPSAEAQRAPHAPIDFKKPKQGQEKVLTAAELAMVRSGPLAQVAPPPGVSGEPPQPPLLLKPTPRPTNSALTAISPAEATAFVLRSSQRATTTALAESTPIPVVATPNANNKDGTSGAGHVAPTIVISGESIAEARVQEETVFIQTSPVESLQVSSGTPKSEVSQQTGQEAQVTAPSTEAKASVERKAPQAEYLTVNEANPTVWSLSKKILMDHGIEATDANVARLAIVLCEDNGIASTGLGVDGYFMIDTQMPDGTQIQYTDRAKLETLRIASN